MLSSCSRHSSWILETSCFKILPMPQSTGCQTFEAPLTLNQAIPLNFFQLRRILHWYVRRDCHKREQILFYSQKNSLLSVCFVFTRDWTWYPPRHLGVTWNSLIHSLKFNTDTDLSVEMQICRVHWLFSSPGPEFVTQTWWLRLSCFLSLISSVVLQSMANSIWTWSALNLLSGMNLSHFCHNWVKKCLPL